MGWGFPCCGALPGIGILINETTGEFPQKEQELFEGIVAVIAVVILTWMVFWMRKVSRNVKVQLEQAVDNALQKGNHHGWALIMMVFFAVAREGLESVFFLLAAFQQDVGIWPPLGAVLGLATAVVLGFLLYWGGIRLNLGAFFKWDQPVYSAGGRRAGGRGDPRLPRSGSVESLPGHGVRSQQRPVDPFTDRYPARRDLRLPGNAERQRSGDVLYLSGSGADPVRYAAAYRLADVARSAVSAVLVTTYF